MARLTQITSLTQRPIEANDDLGQVLDDVDLLSVSTGSKSRYLTGFAVSRRCVESALRLRYEVFNLELGEGLETSEATGLDEDPFDAQMTHLILFDQESASVAGTYRLQTMAQASGTERGLYSAQEFDLSPMEALFSISTECGRACLAKEHRNMRALIQLWLGIGAFMNLYEQQYLFGCCSLNSTDPSKGWKALQVLKEEGHLHRDLRMPATRDFSCGAPEIGIQSEGLRLPKLFRIYLRLGAKVVSEPALDRDFGTIDFLVLLNAKEVGMSSLNVVV